MVTIFSVTNCLKNYYNVHSKCALNNIVITERLKSVSRSTWRWNWEYFFFNIYQTKVRVLHQVRKTGANYGLGCQEICLLSKYYGEVREFSFLFI